MTTSEIVDFFVNDTLKASAGIFFLVLSWKIYRLKCETILSSGCLKFTGSNAGGPADIESPPV